MKEEPTKQDEPPKEGGEAPKGEESGEVEIVQESGSSSGKGKKKEKEPEKEAQELNDDQVREVLGKLPAHIVPPDVV